MTTVVLEHLLIFVLGAI